jgi:hypothetical protein
VAEHAACVTDKWNALDLLHKLMSLCARTAFTADCCAVQSELFCRLLLRLQDLPQKKEWHA